MKTGIKSLLSNLSVTLTAGNTQKAISVFILISLTFLLKSQQKGIHFEKGSFAEIISKAKKENKMIFVDCYTSWCAPCKWMAKEVFTNDTVANYYTTHFICAKFDMEHGEGLILAKKYAVKAYPTMLYLDASGLLQHKVCGSDFAKGFIKNGEDAMTPETRLSTYASRFKKNPNDRAVVSRYLEMLEAACYQADTVALKLLSLQKENELTSYGNWKLIYKYADYSSKSFKYLVAKKDLYSRLFDADSVEDKLDRIYGSELLHASLAKNTKKFEALKTEFKKCKTKHYQSVIKNSEVIVTKLVNDRFSTAIEIQDSIIGPENVSLNHEAWYWFKIDHDTTLFFDIVPNDSLDDYDFSLYKANNKSLMSTEKPIRTCYSYCTSKSGITSLSEYTTLTDIGDGVGPAYVSSLKVKAGDTFYLKVYSQFLTVKGYRIYFYNYWHRKKPTVLKNIFFESNQAVLLKESFPELDELVLKLKANQMKIEIRGHSDNQGDAKSNQVLSEKRAKAVYSYLISKKISPERLFYKGFGNVQPIATNDTEDGRKKNRRVEFVVIMY